MKSKIVNRFILYHWLGLVLARVVVKVDGQVGNVEIQILQNLQNQINLLNRTTVNNQMQIAALSRKLDIHILQDQLNFINLQKANNDLARNITLLTARVGVTEANLGVVNNRLGVNEAKLADLTSRVGLDEVQYIILSNRVGINERNITKLTGRVGINEVTVAIALAQIDNLDVRVSNSSKKIVKLQMANKLWKDNFRIVNRTFQSLRRKVTFIIPSFTIPI